MPPDGQIDFSQGGFHTPPYQSKICFANISVFELGRQMLMRCRGFSNDHHTRGILIQTMDDARTNLSAKGRQIGTMVEQSIDQSARQMARGGVNHQAGGLVDNH